MAKAKASTDTGAVDILQVEFGTIELCVLGTSPIILNRMSEKARHELLLPRAGKKSAAEKATTLKHNPIEEFRASAYTSPSDTSPTLLAILATSFKGSMATAALDLPGAKKAQIGRLTHVKGDIGADRISLYGVPQLSMSIVRSADMNKTPDVRTRAIVPEWACFLSINYVKPLMRPNAVANLLGAAGMTIGVGDWRSEKGKGNYGSFAIVGPDDERFTAIIKNGGRAAQIAAMESPSCYDDESTSLLGWFEQELSHRNMRGVA